MLLSCCHSTSNVSPRISDLSRSTEISVSTRIKLIITCGIHALPLQVDPVGNLAIFCMPSRGVILLLRNTHTQKSETHLTEKMGSFPKIHSPGIHSRHTTTTATRHGQSTSIRRGITPPSCPLRQDSERSISFRPLLPPFVSSCVCKPSVTELCLAFPTRSVRCLSGMLLLQLLSYPLVLPAAWTPGWVLRPPLRSMVFWPTSVPTVLMRRALSLA